MKALPHIPFVPTKNFTPATGRKVDLVVIHDMEYPEREAAAESVARYFATTSRQVSSHYCIDANSIVQCVKLKDVAWCAPGANHDGIHLEHAGYARQSAAEWRDPYSQAMLELSAELTAHLCDWYGLPIRFLDAAELKRGRRGITTHAAVSEAFKGSSHWDPGPHFPMEWYLGRVKAQSGKKPRPNDKPWPVPLPKWFWPWARWYLGEGEFRNMARMTAHRPAAPHRIPDWAFKRLQALLDHRKGL